MKDEKYYDALKHFNSCVAYDLHSDEDAQLGLRLVDTILTFEPGYRCPMAHVFKLTDITVNEAASTIPYITGDALDICDPFFADEFGNELSKEEVRVIIEEDDTNKLKTTHLWIERT